MEGHEEFLRGPQAGAIETALRYNEVGRHAEAARELVRALAVDPAEPALLAELARTHVMAGEPEQGRAPAEQAISLEPEWALPHVLLAVIHSQAGRNRAAEEAVLDALRLDPEFAWPYRVYGQLLFKTGHLEKAERVLRRGLGVDPDDPDLHRLLALVHAERNQSERALSHAHEGLGHAPDEVGSHVALGHSLIQGGRPFRARRHFREALRLAPSPEREEDWLEADKVCRWIYLPYYHYGLLLQRLPGRQFTIWIAFVGFLFLGPRLGVPGGVAVVVALGYLALCIYTWVAEGLVRLWIRLRPPR